MDLVTNIKQEWRPVLTWAFRHKSPLKFYYLPNTTILGICGEDLVWLSGEFWTFLGSPDIINTYQYEKRVITAGGEDQNGSTYGANIL